jgi:hypothetical protein
VLIRSYSALKMCGMPCPAEIGVHTIGPALVRFVLTAKCRKVCNNGAIAVAMAAIVKVREVADLVSKIPAECVLFFLGDLLSEACYMRPATLHRLKFMLRG